MLGTGPAELTWVPVAGIVAVVFVAGPDDLLGASLPGTGAAELTLVLVADVVAVALAPGLDDLPGASLLGRGPAELASASGLWVGSFQDFSLVCLLYQYFFPLTSYSFHGWLAEAASVFAAGPFIVVAACGTAVAADFGAGSFAAAATCAVGPFHDFSFVCLLYQYFFPVRNCQTSEFAVSKGLLLTSRLNCINLPW